MKEIWRRLAYVFVFCIGFAFCLLMEGENTYAADGGYEYSVSDNGTAVLTGYKGSETDIIIPEKLGGMTVGSIGDFAFQQCSDLASVVIPNCVTSIGKYAFWNCSALSSVTIPDSVKNIGDHAFWNCSCLTDITIPDSIGNIASSVFEGCRSLTYVALPNGVTAIGSYAFFGCSGLTGVEIPTSVKYIDSFSFHECSSLASVMVPASVVAIGSGAFGGCSSLTDITIENENAAYTLIDGIVYDKEKTKLIFCPGGKKGIVNIPDDVTSIGMYAFEGCSRLTGIKVSESVTSIQYGAFTDCSSLAGIALPAGLENIEAHVFSGCSSLTDITVEEGNLSYSLIDGALYNKDKTELILYPRCIKGTAIIPDGVTSIGMYAFEGCSDLTSMMVPASVTYVGYRAFGNCSGLAGIELLDGVTIIGARAFQGCSGLINVTVPISVSAIEYEAFAGCTNLKSVLYGGSRTQWNQISIGAGNEKLQATAIQYAVSDSDKADQTPEAGNPQKPAQPSDSGSSFADPSLQVPQKLTAANVSLSPKSLVYNGKPQQPAIIVKDNSGKNVEKVNYKALFKNNKQIGTASVTLTFKGNYKGTVKKAFEIVPRGTAISGLAATKKGFTVKWKRQRIQASGYEIQYSTDRKFVKKKTKLKAVKKTSKTNLIIKNLKPAKKYYVRIRTYKVVKGKRYDSAWSKAKSVKIRK